MATDKTFTDKDILRIITNNLDNNEKKAVVFFILSNFELMWIGNKLEIVPRGTGQQTVDEANIISSTISSMVSILRGKGFGFVADILENILVE